MTRKVLVSLVLSGLFAVTATASQFVPWSFDRMARESEVVVRGSVVETWSEWNSSGDMIHTYARVQVGNYLAGQGRSTITVKEVGGTVDGYTQEAIGFPVLRKGEDVVLFLTRWADTGDLRIQAYNQGKFLVRQNSEGREELTPDLFTQGADRQHGDVVPSRALDSDEFDMMLGASLKAVASTPVAQ